MFTLKIIKIGNDWISYDKHHYGGSDLKQKLAFEHICPNGYVPDWLVESHLFEMASLHGWAVETVSIVDKIV